MSDLRNVTLRIMLGLGSGPLEEDPTWVDITDAAKKLSTDRGRSSVVDRVDPGTGRITVRNHDGAFDPINSSSPYYPDLKISTPILMEVDHDTVTYPVFRGMIETLPIEYTSAGKHSTAEITFTDLMTALAGASIEGQEYPEELSGSRIHAVLDDVGWPAGMRDIDVGSSLLPAASPGGTALNHIQQVLDVEAGFFFIAANGDAVFRARASGAIVPEATFSDTAGVSYRNISRNYNRDFFYNTVIATRPDGAPQTAADDDSIDEFGPFALPIDAPFRDDNAALNVAQWQLARLANIVDRIESLQINPDSDESTMWPVAVGLELRDGVTVEFQPPGGGDAVNQQSVVEGIQHEVDAQADTWITTFKVWALSDVENQGYWILGESALDVDAVLA